MSGKPPTTANELIEFAAHNAAEMFKQMGELRPIWHVVCANGDHGVIAAPLGKGGAEKDVVADAMREVFRRMDVVACVFMCESWLRLARGAETLDEAAIKRKGIQDDPQRKECLWFAAEDAEGETTAYQLIERPDGPEGRGVLQPLTRLSKLSRMEGRYVGMLPVKGKAN
jgi:hypothetical protein